MRCEFSPMSGAYAGDQCNKTAKFLVFNQEHPEDWRQNVCGKHIGAAIEANSHPTARDVSVRPDYWNRED